MYISWNHVMHSTEVCDGKEHLIDANNMDVSLIPSNLGNMPLQGSNVDYVELDNTNSIIVQIDGKNVQVSMCDTDAMTLY